MSAFGGIYADQGLEGLQHKPRPGKYPIYTKTTDKRILKLLDKPSPQGFARWTGPLLAEALGDVNVQYVWRFLRSDKVGRSISHPSFLSVVRHDFRRRLDFMQSTLHQLLRLVGAVSCRKASRFPLSDRARPIRARSLRYPGGCQD
ncbi:hypothetical protein ACVME8_010089 [Bradyrhizobium diazoefficiens]